MNKARNFRNYKVWQDSVAYCVKIYQQTDKMPWFEKKGLCNQLQRASVSIGSNIAEGSAKPSNAEFAHYLDMALGSAYEVETQLLIANKIGYIKNEDDNDNEKGPSYEELLAGIQEIEKQLAGLIRTLRK
ncbi:MAG: four helix bundle protein [Bacteroidales bacterium]|nr:four helix bundle protein [Bacteroidales bacterium]